MQVCVGGIPAEAEVVTELWQYWQSILRLTCSAWLNGTGWVGLFRANAGYGERL
jgi:hypothetical protein